MYDQSLINPIIFFIRSECLMIILGRQKISTSTVKCFLLVICLEQCCSLCLMIILGRQKITTSTVKCFFLLVICLEQCCSLLSFKLTNYIWKYLGTILVIKLQTVWGSRLHSSRGVSWSFIQIYIHTNKCTYACLNMIWLKNLHILSFVWF